MASRSAPVIAVDIGSSNTHAGLVDTDRLACLFRREIPSPEIESRFGDILDAIIKRAAAPAASLPVLIGGGRSGAARCIESISRAAGTVSIANLMHHERLPLTFRYERPRSLGADRIANALFAAAMFPRRNCIVISCGTAITADAVTSREEFIGGVIMAGAHIQLRGLATSTTSLPPLDLPRDTPTLPGTSTESCIYAGTIHGIAGALSHFVRKYRKLLGGNCLVRATGGGWNALERIVDFRVTALPDMTLIGTALYTKW